MDNAAWQKYLKILSIFYMIFDVVLIVIFALAAGAVFGTDTTLALMDVDPSVFGDADVSSAIMVLSVCSIVAYLINLICTFFVYRGAKDPAKMKPGMIFYGIFSVLAVFGLVSNLIGGTFSIGMLAQYGITWIIFYGTLQVNKLAK